MFSRLFILIVLLVFCFNAFTSWAGDVSVFVYHRFGDKRYPSTNIALETFAAQLRWLKSQGYQVLPLEEIVRSLKEGVPLPEHCAALTVDDAYRTFLTGAMPLLRKYGFPITLFVSTDAVGRKDYLSWDELRELVGEGVEIGNHTASHDYLIDRRKGEDAKHWHGRIRRDILKAQGLLKSHLGREASLFAYPYGEYTPAVRDVVRELGFAGAFGQQSGVIYQGSDPYVLSRFPMGGTYAHLQDFQEKLAMKALPAVVLSPATPIVAKENPPTLVVSITDRGADLSRLRCYVNGEAAAVVLPDPAKAGRFTIRAEHPLEGRRSKYTLTAPARNGKGWYWFSQLWVKPG